MDDYNTKIVHQSATTFDVEPIVCEKSILILGRVTDHPRNEWTSEILRDAREGFRYTLNWCEEFFKDRDLVETKFIDTS